MAKIYRYVVAHDVGAAPNVEGGLCTLALCKPAIRRTAERGDWIVGLWPVPDRYRITFVMQVEDSLDFAEYWNDPRFSQKKPGRTLTPDNIYHPDSHGRPSWTENPIHKRTEAAKDLSGVFVLVSDRFWYFGDKSVDLPLDYRDLDLPNPRRGHRVTVYDNGKMQRFVAWLMSRGRGVLGSPRDELKSELTTRSKRATASQKAWTTPQVSCQC